MTKCKKLFCIFVSLTLKYIIMALSTAKFKTNDVVKYLNQQYTFASKCFANDFKEETVLSTDVEKWFKSYFVFNARYMFRLLETSVCQHVSL